MANLKKVRVQLLNPETNEVVEEVNVLTSADSVTFADGETFQQKLDAGKLKGQTGNTGATGATGAKGADGATWLFGTSAPAASAGKDGDGYLNTATYDIYKKTSGAWSKQGNIKGATGATGQTGATGATGPQGAAGAAGAKGADGATWYTGTGVTGTSTTGTVFSGSGVSAAKVNDLYLNSSTGAVYKCTTAGAASVAKWAYLCSIKGPKGDTGAQGAQGIQGPAGAKGATGGTGPQGPKGADGDKIKVGTTLSAATEYKLFFKVQ